MRIGYLGNADSWYATDLHRAVERLGHSIEYLSFSELHGHVAPGPIPVTDPPAEPATLASNADSLLVRSMPPGSLEQVIFRMDVLRSLEKCGVRVLNTPRALEVSIDKYLSLCLLSGAGIPVPESFVCQTVEQAIQGFERLDRDVVIKPLFGSEGKGITRVTDPELALRAFKLLTQYGGVIYMQRFIEHDHCDFRLLILGDEVFAMSRRNPTDWRTNAARGAVCERWTPTDESVDLALQSANVVGAEFAGVDIVFDTSGRPFVLEINAVPGWRSIARATGVDVADRIVKFMASRISLQSIR